MVGGIDLAVGNGRTRSQNPIANHIPLTRKQTHPCEHIMAHHEDDHSYHAKDAISAAMKATMLTGGVGLFASAVQNTLTRQNVGPLGIFIRGGGTIGVFGMQSYEYDSVLLLN